jgi:uncharacterized membrane protein (DUF106 family)
MKNIVLSEKDVRSLMEVLKEPIVIIAFIIVILLFGWMFYNESKYDENDQRIKK